MAPCGPGACAAEPCSLSESSVSPHLLQKALLSLAGPLHPLRAAQDPHPAQFESLSSIRAAPLRVLTAPTLQVGKLRLRQGQKHQQEGARVSLTQTKRSLSPMVLGMSSDPVTHFLKPSPGSPGHLTRGYPFGGPPTLRASLLPPASLGVWVQKPQTVAPKGWSLFSSRLCPQ